MCLYRKPVNIRLLSPTKNTKFLSDLFSLKNIDCSLSLSPLSLVTKNAFFADLWAIRGWMVADQRLLPALKPSKHSSTFPCCSTPVWMVRNCGFARSLSKAAWIPKLWRWWWKNCAKRAAPFGHRPRGMEARSQNELWPCTSLPPSFM